MYSLKPIRSRRHCVPDRSGQGRQRSVRESYGSNVAASDTISDRVLLALGLSAIRLPRDGTR